MEINDYNLTALEVDKINSNCPPLSEEEQRIHDELTEE